RALGAEVPDWALERATAGVAVERKAAARSPLNDLLLRYARTHTTVTPQRVAQAFGLGTAVAEGALAELAGDGSLVDLSAAGWMEPAILARVRRRSLDRARAAVAPVPPAALQRLVLERAGLDEPGSGVDTLAEALAALEGVWLPAGLWESVVLPARVADYRPAMLDELIASGEVVWQARPVGDAASRSGAARVRSRAADVPAPGEIAFFPTDSALAPVAGEAITPGEPEGRETGVTGEELWQMVREGAATGRSFEP
ncbi:Lhr family ATP-dependent helicase, partial [Actinomyces oris]|uniref:Lhr family ATP-dependent helicase n=1 Tax=Actinomyces oris TaxID=544580 RepID=UPI003D178B8D